jgi:large subunit ribosomal protein L29
VKATEVRELTRDELEAKATAMRGEYFGARVRFATGQLENTAKLRSLRRDIARLETILREKAGRAAPGPPSDPTGPKASGRPSREVGASR